MATLNRGITTVLGTFAAAATVAVMSPSQAAADTFASYTGQATTNLNVRSTPDTSHAKIGMLKKGDTFTVEAIAGKSEKGNWLKITYQNKDAYVDGYYVTRQPAAATTATQSVEKVSAYEAQTTTNLHVRFLPSASGSVLTTLKKGSPLTVTGKTADGWLQISYKSGSAYVFGKYVGQAAQTTVSKDVTATVNTANYEGKTTANLNVRRGASTSYSIVTTLKQGSSVKVVGTSGSWLEISQDGVSGWVYASYVTKSTPQATAGETAAVQYTGTTTANLNVRSEASTSGHIITTLKKGSSVSVTGTSGNWLKISYNGGEAFVAADYISKSSDVSDASNEPAASSNSSSNILYQRVTTANLNVRENASVASRILTTLKKGTTVNVTGKTGNWLQISYNNSAAYVSADYVTAPVTTASTDSSSSVQAVITTAVNFRERPSMSSKVYQTLSSGTLVEWLADASDGWVKISYGGKDGYVYGDYIEKQTASSISGSNSAIEKTSYALSFASALAKEEQVSDASATEIADYLNPNNFTAGTAAYYQFLKLSTTVNVDADTLNKILAGRGTLAGQGQAFLDAARASKVNVFYLIAHACLETGNGSSSLAQGVNVDGKTVYNMYGIAAYDGSAVPSAAGYAAYEGWTTPAAAIEGGAQWIATYYIYRSNYQQDTLYKMRWNPVALASGSAAHQYATDVGWAVKQTAMMNNLYSYVTGANLIFDVPQYSN
ncbi:MAG: SH3 domain-containing protein [Sporolactobacillus sp.]